MWFEQYNRYQIFTVLIFVLIYNGCEAVSNSNFNDQIRDYSVINDNVNMTNVKTLQKEHLGLGNEGLGRYANFAPLQNTIRFKDVPDNVLSGSSHGRGLLHHDHAGYGIFEYEDPNYGHGYEFQHNADHHIPHDYHHYDFHDDHHHTGHHVNDFGYHHKHYDHHALAAKTILWPIAGLALLGAAAALVSNPVLVQLGVVSGRKKRHIENLDIVKDSIKKWAPKPALQDKDEQTLPNFFVKRRFIQKDNLNVHPTDEIKDDLEHKSNFKILKVLSRRYTDKKEAQMVPVPLKFKKP